MQTTSRESGHLVDETLFHTEDRRVAQRTNVLILGCGVSALVAARVLARQGLAVTILDHYPAAGGNHISVTVDGRVFDIGAIHFTRRDDFFAVFPEMQTVCLERRLTAQKVSSDLRVRRFPMEASDFTELPLRVKLAIPFSLVLGRLRRGQPANAAEFIERLVGRVFFERSGLAFYVERLFGTSPTLIAQEFGERRLRWLVANTSLRTNLRKLVGGLFTRRGTTAARAPPSISCVRPPEGFARYYQTALDALAKDGVSIHLGVSIGKIARSGDRMRVETDRGCFVADRLVSTMPIAAVSRLSGLPSPRLQGVDLLSLFVVFEGPKRFTGTVLYNFHHDGGWKRLTVLSDLYGPISEEGYLTVEIPCCQGTGNAAEAFERFRDHALNAGIFAGGLRLVGSHRLAEAYPLLDVGCGERREQALRRLQEAGVEALGRHGTFEYVPHQSIAARNAKAFAAT